MFKVFNPIVGKSTLKSCFFFGNLIKIPLKFFIFLIFLSIFFVPFPSIEITLLFLTTTP